MKTVDKIANEMLILIVQK